MAQDREYFDINAGDFSPEFQSLVAENRALYEQQKAIAKRMTEMLNAEIDREALPPFHAVVGVAWTRWGQMQAITATPTVKASTNKPRKTLGAYKAEQEASGHNV